MPIVSLFSESDDEISEYASCDEEEQEEQPEE
jgi:hypothetical protein